MNALRQHDGSDWQGPHSRDARATPADAVIPLRLMVLPEQRPVEVARPAVVVGRHSDVELRLAYPDVSRRHCRLVYADGVWQIQDLDSLNGLFVNDERMHEATLYEGDRIRVGAVTLLVTAAPLPEQLRSIGEALAAQ